MNLPQSFLDRYAFVGDQPSVSKTLRRLDWCHLLRELGYQHGAEIGVWQGLFSEAICQAVPGVDLTCVDPWQWYEDYIDKKNDAARMPGAYEAAVERLSPYDCTILRMTSLEGARRIPDGSLDFVYIDGNHGARYVRDDLKAWVPKVRRGGMVAGHDYTLRGKHIEVKPVVDRFTREHGISPWYVAAGEKSPSFFWMVA